LGEDGFHRFRPFFSKKKDLPRIRELWKAVINDYVEIFQLPYGPLNDSDNVDVHLSFTSNKLKIIHKLKHQNRSYLVDVAKFCEDCWTWELGEDGWQKKPAAVPFAWFDDLKRFEPSVMNKARVFGYWTRLKTIIEQRLGSEKAQAYVEENKKRVSFCPQCNGELIFIEQVPVLPPLTPVLTIERGGYVRLWGVKPPPDPAKPAWWENKWLEY
jgi:hypothetical protein